MSGTALGPSKRCPKCGALAPLNAPLCTTCGRAFRGTVGQGAPPDLAPTAGPPPLLATPPIPSAATGSATTDAHRRDAEEGTRISLVLIAVFVVGTVLLAIVAAATSRRSGANPVPGRASSGAAISAIRTASVPSAPSVEVTTTTLSLYRNIENRSQYEAAVTLRISARLHHGTSKSICGPSTPRAS